MSLVVCFHDYNIIAESFMVREPSRLFSTILIIARRFYIKKHVWVLCDVQFRLLENVRQHSEFSYDLSRIMTKDNMEYLPLRMRESLRK